MEEGTNIINTKRILDMYQDYLTDTDDTFKEEEFKKFIKFLEIDFFDWVRENLRQFSK